MKKKCNRCLEEKSLTEFFKDKGHSTGHYSICKACKQAATYKWREENRGKYNDGAKLWRKRHPRNIREWRIRRKFGLSHAQYDEMANRQGNKCAICEQGPVGGREYLSIDHCHKTGKVRELLCDNCNKGIGCLQDNPELFIRAAEYLKRHSAP